MRTRGLEPPRPFTIQAPQACAYANSATSAKIFSILTKYERKNNVPQRGLEPPPANADSVLNAACIPFHHCGLALIIPKKPNLWKLFASDFVGDGMIEENSRNFFDQKSLKIKINLLPFLDVLGFSTFL